MQNQYTAMNCKSIFLLLSILASFGNQLFSQETISFLTDPEKTPREQKVDMKHLKLEVHFDVKKAKVFGNVEESFVVLREKVDSIFLDAIDIEFNSVEMDGKAVEYKIKDKGLEIYFPQSLKWGDQHVLEIDYVATPLKGLYFVGWNDSLDINRKQIWTQGQGIDNRHWIPMYDEMNDKLISEMIVHFDENYKVLSNGIRKSVKKGGNGTKIWHYEISKPHAPYLIMLGIGDYAIESRKSASGVPIHLYYYPGEEEKVEPTYLHSVEMFDFFEKEFGVPYPWESYSQIPVQEFMYGAMENTTATIFGDFYLVGPREFLDRNYVRVNAHELAHQWFGDMITARTSTHGWLQEGFATHYDMTYQGIAFGDDFYDWTRRNYALSAIAESEKNFRPIAHSAAGSVRIYPKAALVLQMLKDVVGKEQFNAVIEYYLEKHAYGTVDSEDFVIAFYEKLGLPLDWFFNQWIYRGGEPAYQVKLQKGKDFIEFDVKQVHQRNDVVGLFKMPIDFVVHLNDGSKLEKRVWIEDQQQNVIFDLPEGKEVAFALFDPDSRVLKSMDFPKDKKMLLAQADLAEHMIDRYDALVGLRDYSKDSAMIDFYLKRFEEESFYGIRNEILSQLMLQPTSAYAKTVTEAINDKDVEVRRAVLNNTLVIPSSLEKEYVKLLSDPSFQIIESALQSLCFHFTENTTEYLDSTKDIIGNRAHNVRVKWLEIAYAKSGENKFLEELISYLSASHEFLTRINAAEALKRLNVLTPTAVEYMVDAIMSRNSRLYNPSKDILEHFYAQREYKKMIYDYVGNGNWKDWQFKRLNTFMVP